jgi:DNA repair protein RecO (recombination protein O)
VSVEHSEAVVLRGVDYSQTSRIVTFLSPRRGRLACIAKGVRRPGSGQAAALDTFNRIEIGYVWKESRKVQTLTESSVLDGFAALKTDLDRSACASVALEIALRVAHDNEPSEGLYAALVDGLAAIAAAEPPVDLAACRVVLRLLAAAGFAPTVDICCHTGRPVNGRAGFSYEGGVTVPSARADRQLTAEQVRALQQVAGTGPLPAGADGTEFLKLLSTYAERQLDVTLRSARVLDQLRDTKQRVQTT